MQPDVTPGALYEFHASRARMGTRPGVNDPLTTEAFDTSGSGNHGTLTTFAGTTTSGWDGSGTLADPHRLVLDGTSDYVALPDLGACEDKVFTYEAWAATTSAAQVWAVMEDNGGAGPPAVGLGFSGGKAHIAFYDASWATTDKVCDTLINDGELHHIVFTADGSYMYGYVDGVSDTEPLAVPAAAMGVNNASLGTIIDSTQFLPGSIAVARIYPFTLSEAQVAANFAAGYLWLPYPARTPLPLQRPPITIECAGLLARAKRRQDYCRIWTDLDMGQWHEPDTTTVWTPGIAIQRSGFLQFAAASSSIFPASSYQALDYHLHGGLSTEQDIYGVSFEWTSLGTMKLRVYETALPDSAASWNELGEYGGATNASPDTVDLTCAAGMRGLRIEVGYDGGTTLSSGDEWLKIGNLRVHGQSGSATIGEALADILVDTGLATSYSSVSVV